MITAACSLIAFAAGFALARFLYRNTEAERAAFEDAWRKGQK